MCIQVWVFVVAIRHPIDPTLSWSQIDCLNGEVHLGEAAATGLITGQGSCVDGAALGNREAGGEVGDKNGPLPPCHARPHFHWRAATVHKPDQCPPAPALLDGGNLVDAVCSTTAERLSPGKASSAFPSEISKPRLFSPRPFERNSCVEAQHFLMRECVVRLPLGQVHRRRNTPRHHPRLSKPIVS